MPLVICASLALCAVHGCHAPADWVHVRLLMGICQVHFGLMEECDTIWRRVQDVSIDWDAIKGTA